MSKEFRAQAVGALKKMSVHANRAGGSHILRGIIDEQAVGRVEAISIEQQVVDCWIRFYNVVFAGHDNAVECCQGWIDGAHH